MSHYLPQDNPENNNTHTLYVLGYTMGQEFQTLRVAVRQRDSLRLQISSCLQTQRVFSLGRGRFQYYQYAVSARTVKLYGDRLYRHTKQNETQLVLHYKYAKYIIYNKQYNLCFATELTCGGKGQPIGSHADWSSQQKTWGTEGESPSSQCNTVHCHTISMASSIALSSDVFEQLPQNVPLSQCLLKLKSFKRFWDCEIANATPHLRWGVVHRAWAVGGWNGLPCGVL